MTVSVPDDLPRGIALTSLSPAFRADPHAVLNDARDRCPVLHDGVLRDYVVLSAEIGRKVLADRSLPSDPRNTVETSTVLRGSLGRLRSASTLRPISADSTT
ncbi:MAG: hypothetical protein EOP68_17565 [Sphingomonas sp.]|nr:MAG: hypothetical protein EOP68_17565 [Sphingomonas sp.]